MNNTKQEAATIAKEAEQLEKSRSLEGALSRQAQETNAILRVIDPHILNEQFESGLFKVLTEGEVQMLGLSIAQDYKNHQRFEQLGAKIDQVPERVAEETQCNLKSTRWWGDAIVRPLIGLGVVAVANAIVPKVINRLSSQGIRGTGSDPFSDTSAVAAPRPRARKDNVVPLFDRSAS